MGTYSTAGIDAEKHRGPGQKTTTGRSRCPWRWFSGFPAVRVLVILIESLIRPDFKPIGQAQMGGKKKPSPASPPLFPDSTRWCHPITRRSTMQSVLLSIWRPTPGPHRPVVDCRKKNSPQQDAADHQMSGGPPRATREGENDKLATGPE